MRDVYKTVAYNGREYKVVFNLNVMEKIQEEYGTLGEWGEKTGSEGSEPDVKAVIFAYREMLNEGIDIENEENGTSLPFLTHRQTGRLITDIGLAAASQKLQETVIESTSSPEDEKNA